MPKHSLDEQEFEMRKAAKQDLKVPHTPPHAVPGLRERVTWIENTLGIDSPEE